MADSEKRGLKRFGLKVPALITPIDQTQQLGNICLLSRDLSGVGGFFASQDRFPLEALVDIRLILDFSSSCMSETERYSMIEVGGTILRNEDTGIAVRFDGNFKISPV